ncbi:DUF2953 domain-containing protein [Aquibacillus salsiterrae]|uniref:DUF2953 domain-containing protein n=1 Tax=Aquibacillus salsiterrae TaxID=2950439 RepID=A0A9X3WEV5_9BACI|nr:DUF2953 domain-containing protein [Aquibacillus salsiterrae]MDC3415771.1 DUF2953 domain-containing protein [Aquibacillus salsiterrae]
MLWVIFLLFLIIILFIISYFLRIYTTFYLSLQNEMSYFHIKVRVLGINVYKRKMELPEKQDDATDATNMIEDSKLFTSDNWKVKLKLWNAVKDKVFNLLGKIRLHKFDWTTELGTGDAFLTGIMSGGLWSVKGSIVRLMTDYMTVKTKPTINVVPIFQKKQVNSECECMVSFRLGQTIVAFFHIVRQIKRSENNLNRNLA